MKKTLLLLGTVVSSMTFAQDCSDLFISEYVEGWSNNKALEIYNPTDAAIDLSQYVVIRYNNGATSATSEFAVQLSGTIAPYDVYVGVLDKQDPNGTGYEAPVWDSLAVKADGWHSPVYNDNKTWYWNGNDAIALAKGTVNDLDNAQLVDMFGKIGEDPGEAWTSEFPYTNAGAIVTKDHSMIRKANVLKGVTNPQISHFNPLGEYDSIPAVIDINGQTYGNWATIGSHTCDCASLSTDKVEAAAQVAVFPNPSNGTVYVNGASNFASVEVINALGQKVVSVENNTTSLLKLDLGERKGVYFVKLTDAENKTLVRKVIVK